MGPALLLDGGAIPLSASDGYVFAGYTVATFTGDLGGPIGSNAKCAAEFPGSHLCSDREFKWAGVGVIPGAAGFWIGRTVFPTGSTPSPQPRDVIGATCDNWRSAATDINANFHDVMGIDTSVYGGCATQRQLACCRSGHSTWFRGFTSMTYTGNLGGPLGSNQKCAAEYPGSHLCSDREFKWAGVGVTPGVNGFWAGRTVDSSASTPTPQPRDLIFATCDNWRSAATDINGAYHARNGTEASDYGGCAITRQLACCGR